MTAKLRRKGQPQPPRALSDTELASARIDLIEARLVEHEEWAARLEQRDPGQGRPPAQAAAEREAQLVEHERHVGEITRLRIAADLRETQEREQSGLARTLRRNVLRKAATDDEGAQRFLAELGEAQLQRERKQAAKAKIRELAEKRKHPPDPQSRSVFAALVSDGFLADVIERRPRDDIVLLDDGRERRIAPGEFVNARVIELEDIAVLFVVSLVIANGGLLRLHEPDRGLKGVSDVSASLGRLRRNQLIEAERDGNAWRISWGKRALDIARKAGVRIE